MGSRSQMIDYDRPWSSNILSKKTWAIPSVLYGWEINIKWMYFERQSTTTKIDFPFEIGRVSRKFMDIFLQTWVRIKRGCNSLIGPYKLDLLCWQVSHSCMNSWALSFMFFWKKISLRWWRVLKYPSWVLLWISLNNT